MPDFTPLHRKLELAIADYLARAISDVPAVASESDDKAPLPRIVVRCRVLRERRPPRAGSTWWRGSGSEEPLPGDPPQSEDATR